MVDSDILTIEQAAEYLRIPRASLYRYARAGSIPAMKVGRHWRFSRAALSDWIRGQRAASESLPSGGSPRNVRDGSPVVLIVDDDPAIGKLLATWAAAAGYKPENVSSGQAAIDRLRSGGVGLVYLDVHLLDFNAPQVLKEISGPECPPVVLITGNIESEVTDSALAGSHVVYAMKKPFLREAFLNTLQFFNPPR